MIEIEYLIIRRSGKLGFKVLFPYVEDLYYASLTGINNLKWISPSGITGIFFRGGKVTFSDFFPAWNICFFPVEIFHFGTPQTNFSGFKKWKAKKKERKKKKGPVLIVIPGNKEAREATEAF